MLGITGFSGRVEALLVVPDLHTFLPAAIGAGCVVFHPLRPRQVRHNKHFSFQRFVPGMEIETLQTLELAFVPFQMFVFSETFL